MPKSPEYLRFHAERGLSALIITIEFTLISVMVGVVLFPLMDHAQQLIRTQRFEYWLYILGGALLILYLWSEVITHSLSIIGWPFEFGHNLLYIVFALTFAIQMNFLDDPLTWFAMSTLNAAMASLMTLYDYRMIMRQHAIASGAALQLFKLAHQRQRQLIATLPLTMAGGIIAVIAIVLFPDLMLNQHGHIVMILFQTLLILTLIVRTVRTFNSWQEAILQRAMEELASEGDHT
jgi:hypothetical protein